MIRSFVFSVLILFVFSSCKHFGGKRVRGNGELTTQERSTGQFNKVEVSGSLNVFVFQGDDYLVKVEADENLHQYIEVRNSGNNLEIRPKSGYNLKPRAGIKVYVTAPEYERLTVTGSGNIKGQTPISHPSKIKIEITGSGDVAVEADAPVINSSIMGSGSMKLNGRTRNFTTEISGSGDVHAYNLMSEVTKVEIAGSGDAEVFASKQLKVEIAGSGDVKYKGSPTVDQSIAGSGKIKKAE